MFSKLPTIAQTIRQNGLITKKSLGQHFLTDPNLLDKIVASAGDLSGKTVVEIGPGPGGLTRSLLQANAARVIVIEKDSRCIEILNGLQKIVGEKRLIILNEDALKVKISDIAKDEKIKIVANLPYNIGTELLIRWLDELEYIDSMTLMFQKEVARRITSEPNSKNYGRLAVLSQWLCETRILFDISPAAFSPPPKVESSVISIWPREKPLYEADREVLEKITKATFGQRRKMLKVSLKQITDEPEKILAQARIDPMRRPENLDISEFCALAREYGKC